MENSRFLNKKSVLYISFVFLYGETTHSFTAPAGQTQVDVSATIFSLGIIRHCWNLDKKKCMTPMNDLLFSFSLINKFVWFKYEAKIIHVILCPFCVGFFQFFCLTFFYLKDNVYCIG